ncbi:ABC-three component system protein [Exiguobacterium sp. E4787]|uniref:ABC-three component system protein n=1 Tax=Exiguobacterium sp. E4787 TaxID=2751225 RepID=UPI001BE87A26|nr:ABC-three component system protein [Exiguobacterium sp. E4787]
MLEEMTERVVDSADIDRAIPTWSGFDYQGQVSIYYALMKLNRIDINSVDEYELQIESLEDFSINKNGFPISIHQVKAYMHDSSFSKYKRPIFDLLGKVAKYPTINSCYLHTLIPINLPGDSELKDQLQKIVPNKKKDQFQEFSNLLFEQEKYDEARQKLKLNILRDQECQSVIGRTDIEVQIKKQIQLFLSQKRELLRFEFTETTENINYLYFNFIYEISLLVAAGHCDGTSEAKIPFSKILEILKTEYVYRYSIKTAASSLKNSLSIYFDEYCRKMGFDSETQCKAWTGKWKWILEQSDNDFLLLCKKISPTTNINVSDLEAYSLRELVVKAGVHKTFFPLILEAEGFTLETEGLKEIFVLNKDGVYHLITTIAETWGENEAVTQGKKIYQSLKDDNDLAELLYDVQVFINNEIEGHFDGKIIDPGDDYIETIPNFELKESIVERKQIWFMDVENAKETFKS